MLPLSHQPVLRPMYTLPMDSTAPTPTPASTARSVSSGDAEASRSTSGARTDAVMSPSSPTSGRLEARISPPPDLALLAALYPQNRQSAHETFKEFCFW